MPRGRRAEGGAKGVRRRALFACGLTLGVFAAGAECAASFDPERLSEARDVQLERTKWSERDLESRTVSRGRANAKWLTRLGRLVLRDSGRLPDSSCAVACGRCPDQLSVNVTFEVKGERQWLSLHMREGFAFMQSGSPAGWTAWRFADSTAAVAALLGEVGSGKLIEPGWSPPVREPEALSPDSAAYRYDALFVTGLPEAVDKVVPKYPPVAREADVSGTVRVRALVTADGNVAMVRVAKPIRPRDEWPHYGRLGEPSASESAAASAPLSGMNEAALDAVRQWRFKPASSGRTPVAVWVLVPVHFKLQ